jgi:hypothetical protein
VRGPRRAQVVVGALRSRPMQDAAVLGAVKARPGSAEGSLTARVPAGLDSPLRAAAARFGGRDGRMLAARVEPKNGTWRRMEKPGASVLPQQSTASRFAGSLTVRAHPMTLLESP